MLNGGAPCGALSETEACNGQNCNNDCELKDWSDWGLCSVKCGGGHEGRTRDIKTEATGSGECAPAMSDDRMGWRDCNLHTCPPHIQCTSMVDVTVLLDGSSSLGTYGWDKSKAFIKRFAQTMRGNESGVHLSVLLFSGPSSLEALNNCTGENPDSNPSPADCGLEWVTRDEEDMTKVGPAIDAIEWPAGGTYTSLALAEATSQLVSGRPDAESVVVVVTDGKPASISRTTRASNELKEKARVVWVPVATTTQEDLDAMKGWASSPWEDNFITIDTFAVMDSEPMVNHVVSLFCGGIEEVFFNQTEQDQGDFPGQPGGK